MPDNLDISGPLDAKLVSLTQEHELDGWCAEFNCTRDDLREAVAIVGPSAKAVRDYFENDCGA